MLTIPADHNVEGHLGVIVRRLERPPWDESWASLEPKILTSSDLGLPPDCNDLDLWQACQERGVILITGNRNAEGPESLERAIRGRNEPHHLPIFTLSRPLQIMQSREYVDRVAERLLESRIDLDQYRGAGRIYVP